MNAPRSTEKERIAKQYGVRAEGVTLVPIDDVLRLMAQAWDEGQIALSDDLMRSEEEGFREIPNPYRSIPTEETKA